MADPPERRNAPLPERAPALPTVPVDFNRLLNDATIRLAREETAPETDARVRRAEAEERFQRRVRAGVYFALLLAVVAGMAMTVFSADPYLRAFGRDLVLAIVGGVIGYSLRRPDAGKP